jgi:glycosyltransferase involved in cell wall biosynthesis
MTHAPGLDEFPIKMTKTAHEASRRPLRVCTVAYAFHDSDSRIMRYTHALKARGDEVDVIALRESGRPQVFMSEGVKVIGVQEREVNEQTRFSYLLRIILFFLRTMVVLSWRHLRVRYDVIHVHSVPDFLVFTAWLPKLMGARIVLDIHDLLPELYASKFAMDRKSLTFRLLLAIERISIRFVDHLITANDLWHEKLVERSVARGRATSLMNYPDLEVFTPQGRTRNDGQFVMIYPGSLNWHQGLDIALEAFARIKDKAPHSEFHIYGTGPALDDLIALAKELGLESRVRFSGMLPLREIARVIENADLGVVPKRKNAFGNEAFSTKTLEFMAMGVPVLVSDTKIDTYYFNPSVVRFFRGGSVEDLADQMLALITDGAAREQLRRAGIGFVQKNSWASKKQEYLDLIDALAIG